MSHHFNGMPDYVYDYPCNAPMKHVSSKPLKEYLFPSESSNSPYTTPPINHHNFNLDPCTNQSSSLHHLRYHDDSHLSFNEEDDISAKIDHFSWRVELLELKRGIKNVSEVKCALCESSMHESKFCPYIPIANKIWKAQTSDLYPHHIEDRFHSYQSQGEDFYLLGDDPNSHSYYPSSYSHDYPNSSWSDDSVFQYPEPYPSPPYPFHSDQGFESDAYLPQYEESLEDTLQKFLETTRAVTEIANQSAMLAQTQCKSEIGEFPTQPDLNYEDQCLGEEPLSSDPIGLESVQPMPIPRSDEPFDQLEDPRMVEHVIEENMGQIGESLEEEIHEEKTNKMQESRCQDAIGLTQFEPKFLIFKWVHTLGGQLMLGMFEVFEEVPQSVLIKSTPLNAEFSNDICALVKKIKKHHFENSYVSGNMHEVNGKIQSITTYLLMNWKKRKK